MQCVFQAQYIQRRKTIRIVGLYAREASMVELESVMLASYFIRATGGRPGSRRLRGAGRSNTAVVIATVSLLRRIILQPPYANTRRVSEKETYNMLLERENECRRIWA